MQTLNALEKKKNGIVTAMGYHTYVCSIRRTIPVQTMQVKKGLTLLQIQEKWCSKLTTPTAEYNSIHLSNN